MDPFSTTSLLSAAAPYAAAAVFLVLLIESALPIGFVLPGDTLLLTAGLACATGHLSLPWILGAATGGAVLGAQGGYLVGRLGTRALLPGPRDHRIHRAAVRFERLATRRGYGPALVAARFIPVARSVAGPLSGLVRVPTARFTAWQTAGGITWAGSATLAGYAVGRLEPGLERYVPAFVLVAALSFPITAGLGYLLLRVRARRLLADAPLATTSVPEKETARL
ncbi:DedA family protein [Actinospica sp. MGRD01-02]|uniref:DedA family protein n=1 Tax=Actinospica acidithermotolerans TaxID=2828514 RepID=A0A941EHW6_9ACTN|nr:DedA family protein [Actinospica acidithermotolerans]MBR7830718.1 DedA family protein [Actinospica acidithermotolerans]